MTKAQHDFKYQAVPSLLKEMRSTAGLTQRDVGKKLGKPQSYVHNCEVLNRRVDIAEFIAWAEVCEINPKTAFSRLLKLLREI